MTSKYLKKKIHYNFLKLCFKFVFITKKFKEKNRCYVLETCFKCND